MKLHYYKKGKDFLLFQLKIGVVEVEGKHRKLGLVPDLQFTHCSFILHVSMEPPFKLVESWSYKSQKAGRKQTFTKIKSLVLLPSISSSLRSSDPIKHDQSSCVFRLLSTSRRTGPIHVVFLWLNRMFFSPNPTLTYLLGFLFI